MLEEVLRAANNWFEVLRVSGRFEVSGGSLDLPFVEEGQWYRIEGSVFNDGLHRYPSRELVDESFTGRVSALAVPKAVEDLAADIEAWNRENGHRTQYESETFGDYSYTAKGDATWREAFRGDLRRWRKIG